MTTEKITERQIYEAIAAAASSNAAIELDGETVTAWAWKKIEQIERKAEKARDTAAAKRAAGDALTDALKEILTSEFESVADITAHLNDEEATVGKVSYRLNLLAADETSDVEKGNISVADESGKSRKLVAYRRVNY